MTLREDWRGLVAIIVVMGYMAGSIILGLWASVDEQQRFTSNVGILAGVIVTFYFLQQVHDKNHRDVQQLVEKIESDHNGNGTRRGH